MLFILMKTNPGPRLNPCHRSLHSKAIFQGCALELTDSCWLEIKITFLGSVGVDSRGNTRENVNRRDALKHKGKERKK